MSDAQKQRMLDTIHVHQGMSNLFNQPYDANMFHYIENLLNGGKQ